MKGLFKYHSRCVWPGMPKLPKITRSQFFLQYLKKELSDEVDFLHADKHLSFPQIDTMALMGMVKPSQSSKKKQVCSVF